MVFDTYTTLADAAVAFMLYDLAARKIIKSGVANGVSSVHGRLGHLPTGLVGPNTEDATDDLSPGATPEDHQAGEAGAPQAPLAPLVRTRRLGPLPGLTATGAVISRPGPPSLPVLAGSPPRPPNQPDRSPDAPRSSATTQLFRLIRKIERLLPLAGRTACSCLQPSLAWTQTR